ncbi:hypothetical protein KGY77_08270 [Candidatus Bipolaricaulota bacterium]|nr:hypothetical protein [Candidatus Bipolaricaulota bacterium]
MKKEESNEVMKDFNVETKVTFSSYNNLKTSLKHHKAILPDRIPEIITSYDYSTLTSEVEDFKVNF